MDIANLLATADALEIGIPGMQFNFTALYNPPTHEADGYGCIAAYANILANEGVLPLDMPVGAEGFAAQAADYLGLDRTTALNLFTMNRTPDFSRMRRVTAKQAANCLRNLAITGKLDWEAALKDNDPAMPALPVEIVCSGETV